MTPAYYDSNYLFKLQIAETGSEEVRSHASTISEIHSAFHARAEFASASFRKVREGSASLHDFHRLVNQFKADLLSSTIVLHPLTDTIIDHVEAVYASAPPTTYLRAADAIHLATAARHGFTTIYSNDKHLLRSAHLFGLTPLNHIP